MLQGPIVESIYLKELKNLMSTQTPCRDIVNMLAWFTAIVFIIAEAQKQLRYLSVGSE